MLTLLLAVSQQLETMSLNRFFANHFEPLLPDDDGDRRRRRCCSRPTNDKPHTDNANLVTENDRSRSQKRPASSFMRERVADDASSATVTSTAELSWLLLRDCGGGGGGDEHRAMRRTLGRPQQHLSLYDGHFWQHTFPGQMDTVARQHTAIACWAPATREREREQESG